MTQHDTSEAIGSAPDEVTARDIDLGLALAQLLEPVNLVLAEADRQGPGEAHLPMVRMLRERRDFAARMIERWCEPRMTPPRPPMRFYVERALPGGGQSHPVIPFGAGRDRGPQGVA